MREIDYGDGLVKRFRELNRFLEAAELRGLPAGFRAQPDVPDSFGPHFLLDFQKSANGGFHHFLFRPPEIEGGMEDDDAGAERVGGARCFHDVADGVPKLLGLLCGAVNPVRRVAGEGNAVFFGFRANLERSLLAHLHSAHELDFHRGQAFTLEVSHRLERAALERIDGDSRWAEPYFGCHEKFSPARLIS
ncbi:Uncharacterised protein [uncultured archaeon]|nr:Uncharacterised protein [uncultured archaeon]